MEHPADDPLNGDEPAASGFRPSSLFPSFWQAPSDDEDVPDDSGSGAHPSATRPSRAPEHAAGSLSTAVFPKFDSFSFSSAPRISTSALTLAKTPAEAVPSTRLSQILLRAERQLRETSASTRRDPASLEEARRYAEYEQSLSTDSRAHKRRRRSLDSDRELWSSDSDSDHNSGRDRGHNRDQDRARDRDRGHGRNQTHKDRANDQDRSESRDRDRSRHRHRHRSEKTKKEKRSSHKGRDVSSTAREEYDGFYIDKKGNQGNFQIDGTSKYDLPDYYRQSDRIYGCPGWKIDFKASHRGKGIVLINKRRAGHDSDTYKTRYNDFRAALQTDPIPVKKIIERAATAAASGTIEQDEAADFLQFEPAPVDDDEDETQIRASEIAPVDAASQEYLKRNQEFSQKLSEDPTNLQIWLDYVRLQDTTSKLSKRGKPAEANRSVVEKKLSILERALKSIPKNEQLLDVYMDCFARIFETTAVLDKWDSILKDLPHSPRLWRRYLEFRQTNYASFTASSCLDMYAEAIQIFSRRGQRYQDQDNEHILIDLFTRACVLMNESGYVEQSIACFQALVELNCFCPEKLAALSLDQRLHALEEFWEAGAPRFGEEGAKGWAAFHDAAIPHDVSSLPPAASTSESDVDPSDIYNWWLSEDRDGYRLWMPERNTDDNDYIDPFRPVVFQDVMPFLFQVRSASGRSHIVASLLRLLRLDIHWRPVPTLKHAPDESASIGEPLLLVPSHFWKPSSEHVDIIRCRDVALDRSEAAPSWPSQPSLTDFPMHNFPCGIAEMFSFGEWFGIFQREVMADLVKGGLGMKTFVSNVLQQSRQLALEFDPTVLHLAFECAESPKRAAKLAKGLLKTERMNLMIWNAYAQIEKSRGNFDEARKVYETALMSYGTFPIEYQVDAPILLCMFGLMEVEGGNHDAALDVFCSFMDGKVNYDPSQRTRAAPTRVLRAKKSYQSFWESTRISEPMSSQTLANTHALLTSYIYLEYLSVNADHALDILNRSVLASFEGYTPEGSEPSSISETRRLQCPRLLELLLMTRARILVLHSQQGAYKPGTLREACERALQIMPHNTLIWSVYGWNEKRMGFEGKVRLALDMAVQKSPSCTLVLFHIWSEIHQRHQHNSNIIRSVFEVATQEPRISACPAIWVLYIEFEVLEDNPKRAKLVFFRAIRNCPWSKDLYGLAFRLLYPTFDRDELEEVQKLMEEKELRIRNLLTR
ncbi:NRDE-2, necessary for RNA interference-domain-containing protein [Polychytrium aggregatum]|uniref:NRDE-2, necessary for RNA interference-domain-containing protein n=1 Tax=Polychytrium aggregatum TaxID=110093 RepID=UPI0022FEA811|nr:NRDE-2, necessary for RNA interference-domain-containing protein [Polychytrium aggregatum]KAI9207904.1 NRDE-2, necessary for RNA interference-domain-containing protein [Polychytrium aggregatum]